MTKTSTAAWAAVLSFAFGVLLTMVGYHPDIQYVPIDRTQPKIVVTETLPPLVTPSACPLCTTK